MDSRSVKWPISDHKGQPKKLPVTWSSNSWILPRRWSRSCKILLITIKVKDTCGRTRSKELQLPWIKSRTRWAKLSRKRGWWKAIAKILEPRSSSSVIWNSVFSSTRWPCGCERSKDNNTRQLLLFKQIGKPFILAKSWLRSWKPTQKPAYLLPSSFDVDLTRPVN